MAADSNEILWIVLPLSVIVCLITVARVLLRRRTKRGLWWDDWLALLAVPFVLCINATTLSGYYTIHRKPTSSEYEVFYIPVDDGLPPLTLSQFQRMSRFLLLQFFWYPSALLIIKLSVLAFYFRFSKNTRDRWFTLSLWILAVTIAIWSVFNLVLNGVRCVPLSAAWNPTVNDASCMSGKALYISQAAINVLTDVLLLLIPLPLLLKVQLRRGKKIGLIVVFILGYIVPVFSGVRLLYIIRYFESSNDVQVFLWTSVECSIAIICIAIPSLNSLWKRYTMEKKSSNIDSASKAAKGNNGAAPRLSRSANDVEIAVEKYGRKTVIGRETGIMVTRDIDVKYEV